MVKEEASELLGGHIFSITFLLMDPAPTHRVGTNNFYPLITNDWSSTQFFLKNFRNTTVKIKSILL